MTKMQREEAALQKLEAEGMSRSDAQGVYEAQQLKRALLRYSKQDLETARKSRDGMVITQTRAGNITVDYFPAERAYSLYASNGERLHKAKAAVARAWLIQRYAITYEV